MNSNPPVWAGIALRYADGSVVAIQMDNPRGTLSMSTEEMPREEFMAYLTSGRPIPQVADIRLTGAVTNNWEAGSSEAQRHGAAAISRDPRAIEGGVIDG